MTEQEKTIYFFKRWFTIVIVIFIVFLINILLTKAVNELTDYASDLGIDTQLIKDDRQIVYYVELNNAIEINEILQQEYYESLLDKAKKANLNVENIENSDKSIALKIDDLELMLTSENIEFSEEALQAVPKTCFATSEEAYDYGQQNFDIDNERHTYIVDSCSSPDGVNIYQEENYYSVYWITDNGEIVLDTLENEE